jgi:hypothetical protein
MVVAMPPVMMLADLIGYHTRTRACSSADQGARPSAGYGSDGSTACSRSQDDLCTGMVVVVMMTVSRRKRSRSQGSTHCTQQQ